jgi:hypothetical protein
MEEKTKKYVKNLYFLELYISGLFMLSSLPVILLLPFKLLKFTGKKCDILKPPANGRVRSLLLEAGDAQWNDSIVLRYGNQVEMECDVGFQLVGASILTCLENGHWDDNVPICHPKGCKNPPL